MAHRDRDPALAVQASEGRNPSNTLPPQVDAPLNCTFTHFSARPDRGSIDNAEKFNEIKHLH